MFGDLNSLMQQAKKAHEEMQEELKNKQVEGSAGGGKVVVTANGRQEIVKIFIDPEVIDPDPDEISLLEDMVLAAVNQALEKSRSLIQSKIPAMPEGFDINNIMKMFQK